uniref:Uncharacterized protein n=1 Tax=Lepeophtheirus salmonis TaxID=72036 RepID=A0A0K2TQP1_LEPSM
MPPFFSRIDRKSPRRPTINCSGTSSCSRLKTNYPEDNQVWTQDGAPSHTSTMYQKFYADSSILIQRDMAPIHQILTTGFFNIRHYGEGNKQDLTSKCELTQVIHSG